MRTICVDWNGVLDTYTGYKGPRHFDPPRPGAAAFLKSLRAMGFRVVVLSSRPPGDVLGWLRQHGLDRYVDLVTDRKVPAVAYIDDRAITFNGDFDETLSRLRAFKAHWQGPGQELPKRRGEKERM